MATARVTASTVPQTLFSTPLHSKAKLSDIDIDNQSGVAETITLVDTFTTDAGVLNPAAVQAIPRFQVTVPAGVSFSADVLSLKDIEIIGVLTAVATAIQAACVIILSYHYDDEEA